MRTQTDSKFNIKSRSLRTRLFSDGKIAALCQKPCLGFCFVQFDFEADTLRNRLIYDHAVNGGFCLPIEMSRKLNVGDRRRSGIINFDFQIAVFDTRNADNSHLISCEALNIFCLYREKFIHFFEIVCFNGGNQLVEHTGNRFSIRIDSVVEGQT